NNSTKQVVPKFFLKLCARFRAEVQRYIPERHAFRLIDLFQTINERPALHRNAASVFDDFRVGFEKLRLHIELQADDVASGPSASNRKILAGSCACDGLPVDAHLCRVRPAGDSQEKCELDRLGRHDGNFDVAMPRIICLLTNLQADAVFEMPVELRVVIEVEINALSDGSV